MATVHIIGAGISGLAAATALAEAHVPVKLYEAANAAGGRCRSSHDSTLGTIDHGLHMFSGTAKELQKFIRRIEAKDQFTRLRFPLSVTDGKTAQSWQARPWLPVSAAPLADYAAFMAGLLGRSKALHTMLPELSPLQDSLLQPLARLALQQNSHQASSKQLRRLALRHIRRGATHWFMAKHSLQESLITPALARLEYLGGSVYFGQALKSLDMKSRTLTFARKKLQLEPDDVVIVATPGHATKALFPAITIPAQQHSAITLHYRCDHAQPHGSARVLINAPADLLRYDAGLISATIRVADAAWHGDETLLAERVWRAIQKLHPDLAKIDTPEWAIWREKRAGHVPQDTPISLPPLPDRCLLAGDWLDATRPATMEAAARHGHRAASDALLLLGRKSAPTQHDFYLN